MATAPRCPSLDNILFIDKMPLLAFGFQELIRHINSAALVEFEESHFSVLSRREPAGSEYGLIIVGPDLDNSCQLQTSIQELRSKFPEARMMVYSVAYDPSVILMLEDGIIDACVHIFEPLEEIVSAYDHLLRGVPYISEMLYSLFYEYGLKDAKVLPEPCRK